MPNDARRRAVGRLLVSAGLVATFWIVASTARGFVEHPFDYLSRTLYSSNFAYSQGRFLTPVEAALEITAAVVLIPAVLIAAISLAHLTRRDPLQVVDAKIGDGGWRFAIALSVVACAGAAFVAFGVLQSTYLIDDERAYAFQARLFAAGHLGLPSPPEAFSNPMFLLKPMWTSKYPPGHSLLLTIGTLFGDEHIVPIVLAPILVVVTYSFVRDAFSEKQARLTAALMAASPLVWANFGTLFAWTTTSCAFACFLAAFVRSERSDNAMWAFGAGVAMGVLAVTRPSECLGVSIPFAVAIVVSAIRGTNRDRKRLLGTVLGFTSVAWIILWHDRMVMGNAWKMPYLAGDPGEVYRMGFVAPWPWRPRHTPAAALANIVGAFVRLDLWLFAWPGSMFCVVAGVLRRSKNRYEWLLVASLASYLAVYSLIFAPGTWEAGPAYYIVLLPVLVTLAVRGIQAVRQWFARVSTSERPARVVGWAVALGVGVAWVTVGPIHFANLGLLAREIRLPWETIANADIGNAIIALPRTADLHPSGWAFGYPYEIATGPTTHARLFQPQSLQGLYDAVAYLGPEPIYTLESDADAWARGRHRVYRVVPLTLKPREFGESDAGAQGGTPAP